LAAGKLCATQHTARAVQAVGLRQKALRQRFLIATTAYSPFRSLLTSKSIRDKCT
jgi:hypothetical protein